MPFKDRHQAGRLLAAELTKYKNKDAIILAIPRGGLELGIELSKALSLPLDILITKKIGFPGNPEYAIGAVGPGGEYIVNKEEISRSDISESYIRAEVADLKIKIDEKYERYRGNKKPPELKDKIVIITDDGIATGFTMALSLQIIKKQKPKKIVVAIPVGPPDSIERLKSFADEVICLETPRMFFAIGQFYEEFNQVSDKEAIGYLKEANK